MHLSWIWLLHADGHLPRNGPHGAALRPASSGRRRISFLARPRIDPPRARPLAATASLVRAPGRIKGLSSCSTEPASNSSPSLRRGLTSPHPLFYRFLRELNRPRWGGGLLMSHVFRARVARWRGICIVGSISLTFAWWAACVPTTSASSRLEGGRGGR